MTDFIKKLEKEFNTQIIYSNKHIWRNYYDVDNDGNITTLYLDKIDLKDLYVLLPVAHSLVNLGVLDCNIRTLVTLKSFTRLEILSLRQNNLYGSTLEHLSYLKKLKKLDLRGTNLTDTSSLGTLNNLEMLFIGGSDHLDEIKGLESLKSLYHLDVSNSCINSIENICANENIRVLNLKGTNLKKITHLERFPNLESLNLDGTLVEKIEGLQASKNLKELFISTWRIKRIEGLESLTKLEVLDLYLNEISKIEGLDNLTNLKWLSLNSNKITKVENLDNLTNLELLLLEANESITYFDTAFFHNLISECYIYMRDMMEIERIQTAAPENVKINYNDDYQWPTSLYQVPDNIFE
ncbi:leucine-rich repeat domain-containing protein [Chryseobacterium sp.]|uniref:leucine-rich repeat domain-containing protein n=1 Tax=Chryseobacterium sp. TaxID=1871047 RepID=UPI00260F63E2|nr:leucine-rich repeat domain-containing protein [Chryseobacterium sp.]